MNEFEQIVYNTLRDYQEGILTTAVGERVGVLSPTLTDVYKEIIRAATKGD